MSNNSSHFYEFGPFRLDAAQLLLWRGEDLISLEPKALELLLVLLESGSGLVTKDQLMERLWPNTHVEEANITHNVYKVRQALGETENGENYITTIPRRGYRFVARVTEVRDEEPALVITETTRAHIVVEEDQEPEKVIDTSRTAKPLSLPSQPSKAIASRLWFIGGAVIVLGLVIGLIYATRARQPHTTTTAELHSVAVLPFRPLVAGQRDESLEIGMADTLITRLSNLNQITVRPTSSVRKYTDPQQDAQVAGRELLVDSVLDGNIQKVGDQLRLTARLVRVSDGSTIWAGKFDTQFLNIFAVQDDISEKVAAALSPKLSGEERHGLSRRYTDNLEAYQLYLQGQYHWATFRPPDLLVSVNYYNEALKKDPNYALAYAGLAKSYMVMGIYGPLSSLEAGPKAREAALKALQLDPNLVDAHTAYGGNKIFYEWDWEGARNELQRAQEINTNDVDAHSLYAYYLAAMGKPDDAISEQKRAKELAPQWHIPNNEVLLGLFEAQRYNDAINQSREVLKLEPDNYFAHTIIGQCLTQLGKYDEARLEFDRAAPASHPRALSQLGYLHALTGNKVEALKIVEQLQAKPFSYTPIHVAQIYAGLKNKDEAFAWLNKAYEQRCPFLWRIKVTPQFDELRSDRRYAEIFRRMNLAP
jgi:TolB-like protein/DNA-binding winged helix-turn-helix (wHTH) protein/Flp pilus assembly protein TadD